MEAIANIIQQMGFPIACCVFLGFFVKQLNDQYREDVKALSEKHEANTRQISERYEKALSDVTEKYNENISKFSDAVDRNTQVLTAIKTQLEERGDNTA